MARRPKLTPEQRQERASIAALTRWATENPQANASRGQAGLLAKFEREVREANPGLSDAEVVRRAEAARTAHMRRLAFNRERARQARRAQAG
jgi:hypothetical protein